MVARASDLHVVVAVLRRAGCVFAEDEARIISDAAAGQADALERLLARRCAGEPLELVVGFAELAGARVAIGPGVFVPRRRSERLVHVAAGLLGRVADRPPVVVDLGCGSGALLVAVLGLVPVRCVAYAIDVSPVAVACARANLSHPGARVIEGGGLSALPSTVRGHVDVIIANLPYVPTDAIALLPREARLYEPQTTLDGGPDGLTPFAQAVAEAPTWLRASGHYLGELHESQVGAATQIAQRQGLDFVAAVDTDDGTAVVDLSMRVGPPTAS